MHSVNQLQRDANDNGNNKCKIPRNKFNKRCTIITTQNFTGKTRKQCGTT